MLVKVSFYRTYKTTLKSKMFTRFTDTIDYLVIRTVLGHIELLFHSTNDILQLNSPSRFKKQPAMSSSVQNLSTVRTQLYEHYNTPQPRTDRRPACSWFLLSSNQFHCMNTLKKRVTYPPIPALSYHGGYMTFVLNACDVKKFCSLHQN